MRRRSLRASHPNGSFVSRFNDRGLHGACRWFAARALVNRFQTIRFRPRFLILAHIRAASPCPRLDLALFASVVWKLTT
jgi:hypothetical protein